VKINSAARAEPTRRGSVWVPPPPGTRPTEVSGSPKVAAVLAMIRSAARASSQPPPSAYPSTAAMVGIGSPRTAAKAARMIGRCAVS
jgi:hypothetical protein